VSASRERAVIPKLVRRPVVGAGRIGSREKIRRRHCYAIGIRRGRDQDGAATCGPIPTHPIRRRVPGRQQPVGGGARPVVAFGIAQNASPKKIGSTPVCVCDCSSLFQTLPTFCFNKTKRTEHETPAMEIDILTILVEHS
jgi:hypothetical protein